MKKYSIFTMMVVLIASISLAACSPATPAEDPVIEEDPIVSVEEDQDDELVLTLEELSKYDGQDGNKAYIAVDGVIYDVTDSGPWGDGSHNGFTAGKDLSKEIKEISPHGIAKLENVLEIGTLTE